MITWTDLEEATAARLVAQVTALKYVAAVAHAGLAQPTAYPSAIVWRPESTAISSEVIGGAVRTMWRARVQVIIATRAASTTGESRLATGGLYDIESQVRSALVGFVPSINGTLGIWPFLNAKSDIQDIQPGLISGVAEFTIDMSEVT